ncbi:MAG TPA: FMN-binding glutamate synthase family protein [Arenimonas sp.]|nr:FMN-binding glutamate synthase family protein [Arenimonas sp.]
MLMPPFSRAWFFWLCILISAVSAYLLWQGQKAAYWSFLPFSFMTCVGIHDLLQRKSAIKRNYPILSHVRFMIESVRPELRQYLFESDNDELPFSRQQRSIVYQRAKQELDKRPFGTQSNVYTNNYEWINHSIQPQPVATEAFRIKVGGKSCTKPYEAAVFNISAMSFGALSANAIRALNLGAKKGGFYHDTGEGSISRYHLEHGGDLVWNIGSGYFGCRNEDGTFSEQKFSENAQRDSVKMIELKLSQGAKPGQGGILPGAKVTVEIAEARGVSVGQDCLSPCKHSSFSTPMELLQFLDKLRILSGGKPVGIKLCIGHVWEWFALAKAMQQSQLLPDFIVVDGGEGGTGAAPLEFTDHVGMPLREALMIVHQTLVGLNLRSEIKIGAAGKIITGFDIARTLAIGADWCNAARGFMFAIGCIQSQSCHTGRCPTGVATQDPDRQMGLDPMDKSERVYHFQKNTVKALAELIAAAGLKHTEQLGPEHIIRRVNPETVLPLSKVYPQLKPGSLFHGEPNHPSLREYWLESTAESFDPPASLLNVRTSKLI